MDRLLLDHFQQLMVILYDYMCAIDVGVELFEVKYTDRHSCSMFA